jgi:2-desacetyl-2-hydroxyethyl bacteriochlorophyllide A dehydrogenase
MVSYPRIPGHEISGIVEARGSNVPGHIRPGDTATVLPYTNCGACSSCLAGRINACFNNQTLGVQRDGAACEYISVPWDKIVMAEGLDLDELVMVEPLSVGFHAVSRARVTESDTVAVFGCGMIGMGAISGAMSLTKKIIAVDISDDKLRLAKSMGVTSTVNPSGEDLHTRLYDITAGKGPDVIIEAIGNSQTFRQAVEEVAFAGRVVYVGYVKENVEYETRLFVMKELDIMGSRNAVREDFESVISAIRNGVVNVNSLVSIRVPFEKSGEALKTWSDNTAGILKIIVEL